MQDSKNKEPGSTICTCKIKGERYEIKRNEYNCCGSNLTGFDSCAFFNTDCNLAGVFDWCSKHDIYFIKIESK